VAASEGARVISVRIPTSFRAANKQRLALLEGWNVLPDSAAEDLRRLHSVFVADPSEHSLLLEGLALVVASWADRVQSNEFSGRARPRWMQTVIERLSDLSRTPPLRALAADAGISVVQMSRIFRELEGCTVHEYQRKLRVAAACRLMSESSSPLSHIAIATGFSDQAHFSRTFRKQTGKTPREYRTSLRAPQRMGHVLPGPQLGFDPAGRYPFRSSTSDGTPYEGVLEVTGTSDGYECVVRTSVMPDVAAETVAIHGRRMVLTATVPAGLAILQLNFDRERFTGEWRLAGRATRVTGYRA
jgi:AraC-like DNA-binding protein